MASIRLEPPTHFDIKNPENWLKWKKRFEHYRQASGLADEEETRQVSTLLYCMGEEADDILTSTGISSANRKKYDEVVKKLDDFYKVRTNIILERAQFNRRSQRPGETIEQYITVLYQLIATCEYGTLKDEMLRDRIVVGIADQKLSESLQMDADLTLEKVKKSVRQREAVKEQNCQLQGDGSKNNPIVVDEVRNSSAAGGGRQKGHHHNRKPHRSDKGNPPANTGGTKAAQQCKRCGKVHPKGKCSAITATCLKCNRKGHYAAVCYSKTVSEIATDGGEDFLLAIHSLETSSWNTTISVNGSETSFKMDTGAAVTVISQHTLANLNMGVKLLPASKALYGPTSTQLRTVGQFQATLTKGEKSTVQTVYVIDGLRTNLLGLPAITDLGLITRVDACSSMDIPQRFPSLFQGLGHLGEEYVIRLRDGIKPHAVFTPRNVPIPLRPKVQKELQRMKTLGVISPVTDPTLWCAGMVVVPKRSGDVRICIDLKPLNDGVMRETFPIPAVDDSLAKLAGARVFSKVDANSGFWQIPLAPQSRHLTTFITPFGRFCFNKLPFGISSAPELYQRRMSQILAGLEGVLCHIDDVLIFGATPAEHETRLTAVLTRLAAAGVTLNKDKCEFYQNNIRFLGHLIDQDGIHADPDKVAAIVRLQPPSETSGLRRFLGMVNQLGKFTPKLATLTQPLRELLSSRRTWLWGPAQDQSFNQVKTELTKPMVLSPYSPEAPTKISADASSHGLGAVLMQEVNSHWKPVAFASRAMTETECRYAQIEKAALATTWACDKFSTYILGRSITIETDHKPLVPLLSSKNLDVLPPRILRFRLRMARYTYSIVHVPGKLLYTADTLSRAPLSTSTSEVTLQDSADFIHTVVSSLPVSESRLETYREAQRTDPVCSLVIHYCHQGWPRTSPSSNIGPYWKVRGNLSVHNQLLLYGGRIVVPPALQKETLQAIHEGHQGIVRCRLRIRDLFGGLASQPRLQR